MNLCNIGHSEICFEGKTCPICYIREDLEREIKQLKNDISDLKGDVDQLIREQGNV